MLTFAMNAINCGIRRKRSKKNYPKPKKRRNKAGVMLLPLLPVLLTACCGPTPKPVVLTPSDDWLIPSFYSYEPKTYGDVVDTAWPGCMETLSNCNLDKAAIKSWKTDATKSE